MAVQSMQSHARLGKVAFHHVYMRCGALRPMGALCLPLRATQVVHDRMQELLQRVANEEEATLQRRGLARSAKGRAALTQRLQRMIGLH